MDLLDLLDKVTDPVHDGLRTEDHTLCRYGHPLLQWPPKEGGFEAAVFRWKDFLLHQFRLKVSRWLRAFVLKLHDLNVKVKAVRSLLDVTLPHVTLPAHVATERVDDDRVHRLRTPHLDGVAVGHPLT